MSPTLEQEVLSRLQHIDDAHAGRLVSEQALIELKEAILDIPPAPVRRPDPARRREGRTLSRTVVVLGGAAAVAAIVVAVQAVAGGGPAGVPVANAAVLRGALDALAHPGTILIESYTGVSRIDPKYGRYVPGARPSHIESFRFTAHEITETPAGKGAQNELNLGGPGVSGGREIGEINGTDELYVPKDNTVYLTSHYGHCITKGPRPGMFIYTEPKIANAPAGSAAADANAHIPAPLTITAAEARALRDGTASVESIPDNRAQTSFHLKVVPGFREALQYSDPMGTIRRQLAAGKLRVAGRTTVEGHPAIRLVATHGLAEDDVAPGTYAPLRTVTGTRGNTTTITYHDYRTLPATPANERLLDLTARHPQARVVHSDRAYLAQQG